MKTMSNRARVETTKALLSAGYRLCAGDEGNTAIRGGMRVTDACPTCHGRGCGDCGNSGLFGPALDHRTVYLCVIDG